MLLQHLQRPLELQDRSEQSDKKKSPPSITVETYKFKKKKQTVKPWVPALNLDIGAKRLLSSSTGWLNDTLIDGAQKLLKLANPAIPGLQMVYRPRDFDIQTGEFVQVLNNGNGHWVTISTVGVKSPAVVKVYDSYYCSASDELKMQIASILHSEHPVIQLHFPAVQKQSGSSDCGLFALAFATSIVFNVRPEECLFEQRLMRSHLTSCFEERNISMFPMKRRRLCSTRTLKIDTIQLYCLCRMPEFSSSKWVQCSSCNGWFHAGTCVKVPENCLQRDDVHWYCPGCDSN